MNNDCLFWYSLRNYKLNNNNECKVKLSVNLPGVVVANGVVVVGNDVGAVPSHSLFVMQRIGMDAV